MHYRHCNLLGLLVSFAQLHKNGRAEQREGSWNISYFSLTLRIGYSSGVKLAIATKAIFSKSSVKISGSPWDGYMMHTFDVSLPSLFLFRHSVAKNVCGTGVHRGFFHVFFSTQAWLCRKNVVMMVGEKSLWARLLHSAFQTRSWLILILQPITSRSLGYCKTNWLL